ncbi:unnamed protein product [Cochlearia groenlandica]
MCEEVVHIIDETDDESGAPAKRTAISTLEVFASSSVTMISNSALDRSHLRAIITASKRTRVGSQQIWYAFYSVFF